jgi:hypothetical protein
VIQSRALLSKLQRKSQKPKPRRINQASRAQYLK